MPKFPKNENTIIARNAKNARNVRRAENAKKPIKLGCQKGQKQQ